MQKKDRFRVNEASSVNEEALLSIVQYTHQTNITKNSARTAKKSICQSLRKEKQLRLIKKLYLKTEVLSLRV